MFRARVWPVCILDINFKMTGTTARKLFPPVLAYGNYFPTAASTDPRSGCNSSVKGLVPSIVHFESFNCSRAIDRLSMARFEE